MVKHIIHSFFLTRAVRAMHAGNVQLALSLLNRIKSPQRNVSVIEAMKGYLFIATGNKEAAIQSIKIARASANIKSKNGIFVLKYTDYLESILENNISKFDDLGRKLNLLKDGCDVGDFLIIISTFPG